MVGMAPTTSGVALRRSPGAFVALTVGLSVPFWLLGFIVESPGLGPVGLPVSALQAVVPLIAAALLVVRVEGAAGVARLLRRTMDTGRAASWTRYLLIVALMPAIYALAYLAMRVAGRPVPDPVISPVSVAILVILFFATAVFEEAGWTAYALEPLSHRWGLVRAGLVLGVAWAVVHLVPDTQSGHDAGWIAWHRIGTVALRVLLALAFLVTGRGVLAAVAIHAADNVSWQLFPVSGSHYDPAWVAPITLVAATILVVPIARHARTGAPGRAQHARPGAARHA
jgi:hypothetical protein